MEPAGSAPSPPNDYAAASSAAAPALPRSHEEVKGNLHGADPSRRTLRSQERLPMHGASAGSENGDDGIAALQADRKVSVQELREGLAERQSQAGVFP